MRRSFLIFFLILIPFVLTSCNKAGRITDQELLPENIKLHDNYFTQYVILYEKGRHRTTNYRKGTMVPVNTQVTLLNVGRKMIEVSLPSGQRLEIENVQKHTNDNIYQAFDKLFKKQKVNLARFTKLERKNINAGSVEKGMSKDAVLVAIGYPPVTETPTLNMDAWTYWSNRFNRFKVHFHNGRVSQIED